VSLESSGRERDAWNWGAWGGFVAVMLGFVSWDDCERNRDGYNLLRSQEVLEDNREDDA
jgi:hypothetical protein